MEKRKLTKEDIDKVRGIDGFPVGSDEDIIALSDAPYYTACPNPFIEQFIRENGTPYDEETDDYHREPFTADVSEGKNDAFYMAHSYHTKVPHKAIMKYILHYTNPGDIVFDGFSGTGMTGVAAKMCANPDSELRLTLEHDMKNIKWGARIPILSDISPIASFISNCYNAHTSIAAFEDHASSILQECRDKFEWMFETSHLSSNVNPSLIRSFSGHINYIVWSQMALCPHCGTEFVLYDMMWNPDTKKMSEEFVCPECKSRIKKNDCDKSLETAYDDLTGEIRTSKKSVPVLINYSYGKNRYEKRFDAEDWEVFSKIEKMSYSGAAPHNPMMHKGAEWGETWRAGYHFGITHVHHFYHKRTLLILEYLYEKCKHDSRLLFWFTSCLPKLNIMNRYMPQHGSRALVGPMSGTLYVAPISVENNVIDQFEFQLKKMLKVNSSAGAYCVSTQSLTDANNIPENSVDYIFTDPPFGGNLMYSELSSLWESWIRVSTNNQKEAIVSPAQNKSTVEYSSLMEACFKEYFRVLKPNRWITIEFHNSKNAVWFAIQQALSIAGFVIADVRVLDKQKGTIKQLINTTSVQQDLVISAYKPTQTFISKLHESAGQEETAWSFIREHLEKLPVVVENNSRIEIVSERQAILLFDRMVAYHIVCGLPVPLDASDFYRGLDERFLKRDGMYFLPDQINQYDLARSTMDVEDIQYSLFVSDEKSAIGWLYQQLDENSGDGPQTYQDLMPKFIQELKAVDKHEKLPELLVILEENFLKDDEGRWYIPDLTKSGDIAKLREKNLLKEFQEYMASKGKLKVFRSEAIRAGFAKLWKDKDYAAIVAMAERLPEETIQEDPNLLMYYDISLSRV